MHRIALTRPVCRLVASTIAGSFLVGCGAAPTVAVDHARYAPAEVVEPWQPAAAPADPATESPVDLATLLAFADAHAPRILTARAQVGFAEADLVAARVSIPANPTVAIGAGVRRSGGASGLDLEASVSQQLEVAGQPSARRSAAEAGRTQAEATVNQVRWAVHVEAHRLYAQSLLVAEQRAQVQRFVAFSASLRRIAAQQIEAGETSPLVLLVADAELAQTREALIAIEQRARALDTRLTALVGWPDGRPLRLAGPLPPVRRPPPIPTLLRRMAERHPSVRVRELAVETARRRLALAEREATPDPTVGLAYGREAAPTGGPAADIWLVNLAVPIPVWWSNQDGRARAAAALAVADRQRTGAMIELRAALRRAATALDAAVARVDLYEQSVVPQLEKNLTLLQRAFELGEVDIHRVSQTRQRLLEATRRHVEARVAWHALAAELEGLVGTEIWPEGGE